MNNDMVQKKEIHKMLEERYGELVKIRPPFKVERAYFVENGCCPGLPVALVSNIRPDGSKNYAAQCLCGCWATGGSRSADEVIEEYRRQSFKENYWRKKYSPELQRVLWALYARWIHEPNVSQVEVKLYFRKAGKVHLETISWAGFVDEEIFGMRNAVREKETSYEFNRILEVLEDCWITEPQTDLAISELYFQNREGEPHKEKIIWSASIDDLVG